MLLCSNWSGCEVKYIILLVIMIIKVLRKGRGLITTCFFAVSDIVPCFCQSRKSLLKSYNKNAPEINTDSDDIRIHQQG